MGKISNVIGVCRVVLSSAKYRWAVFGSALIFALLEMWLASYSLILFVYHSDAFSWRDRVSILGSATTLFLTTFGPATLILTFLTALLVGLNGALLIYYFKQRAVWQKAAGVSVAGMLAGLLGVGCASCGSVILSSVFGFSIATNMLGALPLRGSEFGLFAVISLFFSIYIVAQKINSGAVCEIVQPNNHKTST